MSAGAPPRPTATTTMVTATSTRTRLGLIGAAVVLATAATAGPARAGDPMQWQVGADEGACVRLVTGGPRGCAMVPSLIDPGQPGQVWHVPWQEAGLVRGRPALWPINNHGCDVPRPRGAIPMTVMDHTILIVYGPDRRTPVMIGEFLPEAEGNWQTHRPGSPKFNEYMDQLRRGTLVAGPRGTTNGAPVGATYGLGDHCCTNTANAQLNDTYGRGTPARGLNRLGYEMNRCGATPLLRDRVIPGLTDFGRGCQYRANDFAFRFGPGMNRAATCGPDIINNGMMGYQCGSQLGGNTVGLFTNDPTAIETGAFAGGGWGAACMAEGAYTMGTGAYLPAGYSPLYYTHQGLSAGGRGLMYLGRGAAPYAAPATAAVGTVYLVYQANEYRTAVNDLTSMDNIEATPEEFEAMIFLNLGSAAYWQNVGAYWGFCDPLPPPRSTFRGRPRGGQCGGGNVQAPNVDPPYEDGGDDLGGCSTGGRGAGGAGAGALLLCAVGVLALRRRRRDVR